jgi:hypothetical protein
MTASKRRGMPRLKGESRVAVRSNWMVPRGARLEHAFSLPDILPPGLPPVGGGGGWLIREKDSDASSRIVEEALERLATGLLAELESGAP